MKRCHGSAVIAGFFLLAVTTSHAFNINPHSRVLLPCTPTTFSSTALDAKRKRKRKTAPTSAVEEEDASPSAAASVQVEPAADVLPTSLDVSNDNEPIDKDLISEIAKFEFKGEIDDSTALPPPPAELTLQDTSTLSNDPSSINLPNIQDQLKRKQVQQELQQMELEAQQSQQKIKRTDKAAFLKLLEQDPYADANDDFFEKEEYGQVSAWLGEGAAPFLGIPSGPLQVGHFIGALGIVLMAFVEYPGFPLTNLPSPLRGALQGGLGVVYLINLGLAVWAVFLASERGQSSAVWGLKAFGVGGLAIDQLTQLPTLAQIEEAESRKGARGLKKNKIKQLRK